MPNFTFVVTLPVNAAFELLSGNFSTVGRTLSNVTAPGPRYFDQIIVTGWRFAPMGALVPLVYFMSSVTHTVTASGANTEAVRNGAAATVPTGPWIGGPFSSNRTTGGVLLTAISLKGLIT